MIRASIAASLISCAAEQRENLSSSLCEHCQCWPPSGASLCLIRLHLRHLVLSHCIQTSSSSRCTGCTGCAVFPCRFLAAFPPDLRSPAPCGVTRVSSVGTLSISSSASEQAHLFAGASSGFMSGGTKYVSLLTNHLVQPATRNRIQA